MIEQIADYFSLSIWDWFTALIAVLSLIIAVCAFSIAIKTYHVSKKTLASQEQTEKNTTPIINMKIQEIIFNKMLVNLYFDRMKIKAIWNLLKSKDYNYYLTDSVWDTYLIDIDSIHYELFYNESNKFEDIDNLRKRAKDYNAVILSLRDSTKNDVSHDTIEALFRTALNIIDKFPHHFWLIQKEIFGREERYLIPLNNIYASDLILYNRYKAMSPEDLNAVPINYNGDESFILYLGELPFPKNMVLIEIDEEINKHMKRFAPYLIEHK